MDQILEHWTATQNHFPMLLNFAINIISAITILCVGWVVARWFRRRLLGSKITQSRIDPTLRPVISSSIFYIILAMTLYAFMTKLGIPAHSLLAVFGAAGLAIGLALKDTLSNIAAGVMLLVLRPLRVGEFVETPNFTGTVIEIALFATTIKNVEGLYIYVPNGQVWAQRLLNYGRHRERKFIENIGVSYETDLKHAQQLLLKVMENTDELPNPPSQPECYVMNFGDSAITLSCRCWLPPDNWLMRASEMRLNIKEALDQAQIEIPYPQRVLHTKSK